MQLKRLFSSANVRWQHPTEEGWIVWKLLAAPDERILIEERNPTSFESRMRMIEAASGRSVWSAVSPLDNWWSNLTAVSRDRAILEGYTSRDLPIPKGIAAIDLSTGETAWTDSEAQLVEVRANTLVVRRTQYGIERTEVLRLADGAVSGNIDDAPSVTNGAEYPADADREAISRWLTPEELTQLRGPIELLERATERIFCYYLQNPRDASDLMRQTFRCELQVVRVDAENARTSRGYLRETLAAHSPFPVAGNFVVLHDILIYVQEKTRLVGVHLT